VVNVCVPPLRERKEEIPVLVEHFLQLYSAKYGRQLNPISERLMRGFVAYRWPGNVRELENMLKRIVVLQSEDAIADEIFGAPMPSAALEQRAPEPVESPEAESASGAVSLRDIGRRAARDAEREALKRVLFQTNWNRKKAARILEVSYKTLLQKIKECGLGE
jgi:two-component system response regulator AtoC